MYTGDGVFEQVAIINPLAGDYTVELFGLGEEAFVAMDSLTSEGVSFSDFLGEGETTTLSINVASNSNQTNRIIAEDDIFSFDYGTSPLTGNVLTNDNTPYGDERFDLLEQPNSGIVQSIEIDGSLLISPTPRLLSVQIALFTKLLAIVRGRVILLQ